jgi:hypothetical protein
MAHHQRQWRRDISIRRMNSHDIISRHSNLSDFDTTKPKLNHSIMNKLITITFAAITLVVVSSCSTSGSSSSSMPGMSAQEHANMKKGGGSMPGMKM